MDSANNRSEWPPVAMPWLGLSATQGDDLQERSNMINNSTLRRWSRQQNAGPPQSWWDGDDDPFSST